MVMSLLDDNILEETDMILGFPDKNDYTYKINTYKNISREIKNKDKATETVDVKIQYYRCTNWLFKKKKYMPYGIDIIAISHPVGIILKIIADNSLNINGPYLEEELGYIPSNYHTNINIQDILYDFVENIKSRPLEFLKIIETKKFIDKYQSLREFFEINTKYEFIR